jgi:hypothetical protein
VKLEEVRAEAVEARDRFWFIKEIEVAERTASTLTIRFMITAELFVQAFCSERSGRLSLALVGPSGRLYGRDFEHGVWHRHPFDNPQHHEATPVGMSSRPVTQFLAEVEELLLANDLI